MFKKKDTKTKYDVISREIEGQLEKVYTTRKDEVEKELEEKIKLIKEEAEKKIAQEKKGIDQEKKELHEYTSFLAKLESEGKDHLEKIEGHLNQVTEDRDKMRKMAEKMREELEPAIELNQKLDKLQDEANEKANALHNQLKDKYGIEAEIPESVILKEKIKIDLSKEKEKLDQIEELLGPVEFKIPEEKASKAEQPA